MSNIIGPGQMHNPDGTGIGTLDQNEHAPRDEPGELTEDDFKDVDILPPDAEAAEAGDETKAEPDETEGAEGETKGEEGETAGDEELFEIPEEFNLEGYGKATRQDLIDVFKFSEKAEAKISDLESRARSGEDDRLISLGKNFEKLLEDEGFSGELTARNTEPFRKAVEEARKGLERKERDPEVQAMLDDHRVGKTNAQLNEIVEGFKQKYPDIVDEHFDKTVSQEIVKSFSESHSPAVSLLMTKAIISATATLLEAARQKGQSSVAEALAKKPRGTRVVPRTSKRTAKAPEKKPTDYSEEDVLDLLDTAAFGDA